MSPYRILHNVSYRTLNFLVQVCLLLVDWCLDPVSAQILLASLNNGICCGNNEASSAFAFSREF